MRTGVGISRNKYFIFAIIFFIFAILLNITVYISLQKKAVIEKIDKELKLIAEGVPYVLGDDFFVKARKEYAISSEENYKISKKMSDYAEKQGAEYVYTIVMWDGKLYYTSSSSTKEEFAKGDITPFWFSLESYNDTNIAEIIKTIEEMKPLKVTGKDDYGVFRSVYLPKKDINGDVYVVGADYRAEEIKKVVKYSIMFTIANEIYFILSIIPIFFVMTRVVKKYVKELNIRAVTDELTGVANRREAFFSIRKANRICTEK
jgi:c-di-GMP phosphodiesterase